MRRFLFAILMLARGGNREDKRWDLRKIACGKRLFMSKIRAILPSLQLYVLHLTAVPDSVNLGDNQFSVYVGRSSYTWYQLLDSIWTKIIV